MNWQKGTYWIALALAAVAFHGEYQHGAFPTLHRAANCAGIRLNRMAANAERTVAMARLAFASPSVKGDDLGLNIDSGQLADLRELSQELSHDLSEDQQAMLRDQVRARAEMIREQVREHSGEFERVRSLALQQVHIADSMNRRVVVMDAGNCGKIRVRVRTPEALPAVDDDEDTP
ncbi:MAG: hypothetical protein WCB53_15200 [Terriglobales bacterium]